MIVFRSVGGLGNQMFQYATARRLADKTGSELAVDTSWHRQHTPDTTPRSFQLFRLNVRCRGLNRIEAMLAQVYSDRRLSRLPLPRNMDFRQERSFQFDESILHCTDNTYLSGYWQSDKYFRDIRDRLQHDFEPIDPPSERDRETIQLMAGCESVLVHVRRGDYVSLPAAAGHHGTCSIEYYRAAFAVVAKSVAEPVLFVFSDDPAWVRENIRLPAQTVFVSHNSPSEAHQDLRMMSKCRHGIIANSSFSWWGAWLGMDNTQRVVVAPKQWFANGAPTPDLLPQSWRPL